MPMFRLIPVLTILAVLSLLPGPDAAAPWLVGAALADDDGGDDGDDGGDDGDDGDDGPSAGSPSGAGGSRDAGERPQRSAPRATQRSAGGRSAPAPVAAAAPLPDFAENEVVAIGLGPGDLAVLLALGYTVIEDRALPSLGDVRSLRLALPPGRSLDVARAELRRIAPAAAADFNHYYRTDEGPAEPGPCDGPACGPRSQIGWPLAPDQTVPGCSLDGTIGMIDTGVNPDHAALAGRVEVIRLDPGPYQPSDRLHGTAVASLLVGAADSRTPGLLPQSRLIAVDAFHKNGGDQRSNVFDLLSGLDLLAARGVRVINLSLSGPPNATLERLIDRLSAQGVLVVAAVGNGGAQAGLAWPAAYPQVVAVTAVDAAGTIYRRAQQGPHVEFAAPGVQVWAAASVSGGRVRNGTSFATPFVAAAAHVLMGRGLTATEARSALAREARDLGDPGPDPVFGYGLLNARRICALSAG